MHNDDRYARLARIYSTEAMIGPDEGEELLTELLMHAFTPEEAEVACHLPFFYRPKDLKYVARKAEMKPEELKPILDSMVEKGVIRGRGKGYALLPVLPGLFENVLIENKETPWHREFARIASRLYETGYVRKYLTHPTRVVRSIPLEEEIEGKSSVVDPDRVEQMIRAHETMAVLNNCQCRQARYLEGIECSRADRHDGCLAFGDFARLYIERGGARPVDRDAMRAVVRERIDNNLVFFAGNVAAGSPNQICTCCECCCHMLGQIIGVDPGMIVTPPRYIARVREEVCSDCGRCVKSCNLKAHLMLDGSHVFDPARCVGCGLCVGVCPVSAITMEESSEYRPPSSSFKRLGLRLAPSKLLAMIKGKVAGVAGASSGRRGQ